MNVQHFYKAGDRNYVLAKNYLDVFDLDKDTAHLVSLVFTPDPNTGNPRSDVAYMLSGSDPAFKQFIKDNLFGAGPEGSIADTSDEAIALAKKNLITSKEYEKFVINYVKSQYENKED